MQPSLAAFLGETLLATWLHSTVTIHRMSLGCKVVECGRQRSRDKLQALGGKGRDGGAARCLKQEYLGPASAGSSVHIWQDRMPILALTIACQGHVQIMVDTS